MPRWNSSLKRSSREHVGLALFFFFAVAAATAIVMAGVVVVDGFPAKAVITRGGSSSVVRQLQQQQQSAGLLLLSLQQQQRRLILMMRIPDDDDDESTQTRFPPSSADDAAAASRTDFFSRRRALQGMTAACLAVALPPILPASAGLPEIDSKTGNLFTPKADMLKGGSVAARGIPVSKSSSAGGFNRNNNHEVLQSIYETRFVAYLARFLLNFDPSARAYWVQQGFGDTWEQQERTMTPAASDSSSSSSSSSSSRSDGRAKNAFAEFAESVEVGLADYFSGPFGSYSSLPAIVAGINAAQPAPSKKSEMPRKHGFLDAIFSSSGGGKRSRDADKQRTESVAMQKQGILNLYTLLKARYNSLSAKRQLAILFSFVSSPSLQPVNEIRSLLGEADNVTVTDIQIVNAKRVPSEADSRTSSRRGGGYSYGELPKISVDSPPPLGDKYKEAKVAPIMEPTSRVLRITLTDGGEGYTEGAPVVTVLQYNGLVTRQCQATAILDREGRVDSIVVLDPGYGYGGGRKRLPPRVVIEPPRRRTKGQGQQQRQGRAAKAYAQLEYRLAGIQLLDGGTGFVATEPPKVKITPPSEDPDWYIDVQDLATMRMVPVADPEPLGGEVTEMKFADGNIAYSSVNGMPDRDAVINDDLLERLSRDPLELLPSSARPELVRDPGSGKLVYRIPQLSEVPQFVAVMSPRYRADDPIFGGVGRLPVTKGANALTVSEYARLALSGAVCTVVVRTLLNPLELIKTKQQLQNDDELFEYARSKQAGSKERSDEASSTQLQDDSNSISAQLANSSTTTVIAPPRKNTDVVAEVTVSKANVGTIDMIRSIAELRGPLALFQSADITFLASLVFGSFGFGATELFRRSFTEFFFQENGGGSSSGSEIILLLAASLATVLTALAASPFEVLRVRSMGLVESKKWTNVLEDFLVSVLRVAEYSISAHLVTNEGIFVLRMKNPLVACPILG